ncbi:hypothetical protein ACWG0P_12050 [Amedibacillus sp. YH-ame6]
MKKLLTACLCATMLLGVVGCGGSDKEESAKKEYVAEADIKKVYSAPEDYKGKYIKLTGLMLGGVEESEDGFAFQMWQDTENYKNNTVVYLKEDPKLSDKDYVILEGKILGEFEGENAFGSAVTAPAIQAVSVKKGDYKSVIAPTLKEVALENVSSTQNDVTISISKVEFAKNETRVYMKIVNNSGAQFNFYSFNTNAIQGTKQYEHELNFKADYPEIQSDIRSGVTEEGVLVYPVMEQTDFKVIASGSSDNYDLDFTDFEFNVTVK